MYGAIAGDMIGSVYEFNSIKTTEFPLFSRRSHFTDDTVMTVAVAEALMETADLSDLAAVRAAVVKSMQRWGRKYHDAGFGGTFYHWLDKRDPQPYGSFGNGSAMRVSSVGWLADDADQVRELARATADVTHDHPEGVKGAQATAAAIYMARKGKTKDEIRKVIEDEYGYDFSGSLAEIRPHYHFEVSCQKSVPEAILCFFEGDSYESVVRNAVSLGGDADTQAAIAGAIAEAYYGIPEEIVKEARNRLPEDMRSVADAFTAQKTALT